MCNTVRIYVRYMFIHTHSKLQLKRGEERGNTVMAWTSQIPAANSHSRMLWLRAEAITRI